MEIRLLTASDRARWEELARGHHAHFGTEVSAESYEQTWQRLLAGPPCRGIGAWLDGTMVAIAHYVFHAGVWGHGRCYLADLFVDPDVRRRGVARGLIDWVAGDAQAHGFPRLYWNTLEDAPARALYDQVATFNAGLVVYGYRRLDVHPGR